MKKALFAGSFDPFTNGHNDILTRGLQLFDEVTLLIAVSPSKKPFLSVEDRVAMLRSTFSNTKNIKVDSWSGLLVEYAKQKQIKYMLRGLRGLGDFEIEHHMDSMNFNLYSDIETVFLASRGEHAYLSSSLVREVFLHQGDISKFVPAEILTQMKRVNK